MVQGLGLVERDGFSVCNRKCEVTQQFSVRWEDDPATRSQKGETGLLQGVTMCKAWA